jgi:hypothetical protein
MMYSIKKSCCGEMIRYRCPGIGWGGSAALVTGLRRVGGMRYPRVSGLAGGGGKGSSWNGPSVPGQEQPFIIHVVI